MKKTSMGVLAAVACATVAGSGVALAQSATSRYPITTEQRATADQVAQAGVPLSALAPDAPDRYVVKRGDTLWGLSSMYLTSPWRWPELWGMNRQEIANPHLIYPGDVLNLVYVDGKPRITLEQAGPMRLSPQVRSQPLKDAIRAIPYDLLMDFVGRPSLLSKEQIKEAPYVVGMRDRHIVGSTANEIYGRGLGEPAAGARFNVISVGDELRDPDDGDLLGYMGQLAGLGEVIQSTGAVVPGSDSIFKMKREEELTHLRVLQTNREILQGDKLFPATVDIGADFVLSAPANEEVLGQVIAIVDGVHVAGKYQVLALNRGKRHGLAPGNALGVFYRGEQVRDRYDRQNWMAYTANYDRVRLPDERSATVLVFQVYERMSYALVVESSQVIQRGDFVAHPRFGHREAGSQDFIR